MSKFEEMSSGQIMTEIQSLKAEHEALKMKMLKDFDKLEDIEKNFKEANEVLVERIKGKK